MAIYDFYLCRISPRVSRAAVNFGPQSLTIPPGRRSIWKYFETICSHNIKVSKTSSPVVSGRLIRCRYNPLPWHTWQVNNFKWGELATGMSFMQSWWPSLWLDPHHCYYSSSGVSSVMSCVIRYSQLCTQTFLARQDKTGQDKTGQDKTRQDKTRQDKTRQDKTRQGHAVWHDHEIMRGQFQQNHTQNYWVLASEQLVYIQKQDGASNFKIWAQT